MPAIATTSAPAKVRISPEQIKKILHPHVVAFLNNEVTQAQASIIESISVPVVYREDGTVERSNPGQPPRKEEGLLIAGITADVDEANWTGTVSAFRPADEGGNAAQTLEFGGESNFGHIDERPFMRPARDEIAANARPRLIRYLNQR